MATTTLALLSLPVLAVWLLPALSLALCLAHGPCARRLARLRDALRARLAGAAARPASR